MRYGYLVLTALMLAGGTAQAQVTLNLQALDALGGEKQTAKPPVRHAGPQPGHGRRGSTSKSEKPPQPATEQPASAPPASASTTAPEPPPATLPTAPPATVALAPVAPPPPAAEPAAPPPPPPISSAASSEAAQTSAGLRVTFGAGQADLSPASAAAIKGVVETAPAGGNTTFNVVAYAAGTPEDPSTARRLSLSRALAVRSVLMANGVSSSRIYVRALGAVAGDEPPDRVDLAVMGGSAASAVSAGVPATETTPKSQPQ